MMSENDHVDKLQFLTYCTNDESINNEQKIKYRQQRVMVNYERKKWEDVLNDIDIIERTSSLCKSLSLIKLKASIHEHCRKTRLHILQLINNEENTCEHDSLFFNLSQENVDDFIESQISTKRSRPAPKQNKRQKKSS